MEKLITITTTPDGEQAVSARHLHEVLESKRSYTNWVQRKLADLEPGTDYVKYEPTALQFKSGPGRPVTSDYALSLDACKHIALQEKIEKGKQVRQYFIEVEKAYRLQRASMSPLEILVEQAQKQFAAAQQEQEAALGLLQHHYVNHLHPLGEYTLNGYCNHHGRRCPSKPELARLDKAVRLSEGMNLATGKTPHERYGMVKVYHKDVLRTLLGF